VGTGDEAPDQLLANPEPSWRPIPSLDGIYEASDAGTIRRAVGGPGTRAGRLLSRRRMPSGYLTCSPWVGNRGHPRLVHRLVAEAFLGPCPEGQEVNHRNGFKVDNRPVNLEYVTRSANLLHRASGGVGRGVDNASARLTEQTVHAIRRRHAAGEGYKRLAAAYGVTWGTVRAVVKRRTWAWLP
jgi:hypothetical protein